MPGELVLIGCRHRTDSMQPEKTNGPTERAQIKYYLIEMDITVDGGRHFDWRGPRFRLDPNTVIT